MDPRDVIDSYLQGRIESWGVFRKLRKLGLTTATALAVAGALPAAVLANNAGTLGEVNHSAQESPLLDLLISQLAMQLEKVEADGSVRPVAATLARIGGNNNNLADCKLRIDCDPIPLNLNDGRNNLYGELVPDPQAGNLMMNLSGNLGQSSVSLFGIISPRDPATGRNLNLGKVDMNVSGNIGDVPLNFNGNLGNLTSGRVK